MKRKFIVIAGPCVIESEEITLKIAEKLKTISSDLDIDFYFKASMQKMQFRDAVPFMICS